jgi:hypothetical protein
MKSLAFMNGVSLQEFFPLIAKLSQQLRLPVTILDITTTGPGPLNEIGLLDVASITVAPSGSVSLHSTTINPEVSIRAQASKQHALKTTDLQGSPKFPLVYEALSRSFASSLIVTLSKPDQVVPVIYGNKVRYGLPILAARHQLDLIGVLSALGKSNLEIPEIAKHYGVSLGAARRSVGNVHTIARILEAVLWRHGSELVLGKIENSTTSYLTPDDVLGVAPAAKGSRAKFKIQSPSTAGKSTTAPTNGSAEWIEPLKAAIESVISAHGLVRPIHFIEIAQAMDWSEPKTNIEIGRLLTRGKIRPEPFAIQDEQQMLSLHLPGILKGLSDVKLKAVRDAIKGITGRDVEYIQIRIGLKKLGIKVD